MYIDSVLAEPVDAAASHARALLLITLNALVLCDLRFIITTPTLTPSRTAAKYKIHGEFIVNIIGHTIKWKCLKANDYFLSMENAPANAWFNDTLDEIINNLIEAIRIKALELDMMEILNILNRLQNDQSWYNGECIHAKRDVRKALRNCKKINSCFLLIVEIISNFGNKLIT